MTWKVGLVTIVLLVAAVCDPEFIVNPGTNPTLHFLKYLNSAFHIPAPVSSLDPSIGLFVLHIKHCAARSVPFGGALLVQFPHLQSDLPAISHIIQELLLRWGRPARRILVSVIRREAQQQRRALVCSRVGYSARHQRRAIGRSRRALAAGRWNGAGAGKE